MNSTTKGRLDYIELIRDFPPRPIRDDDQLDLALARSNQIALSGELTTDEEDYLYSLNHAIADYEQKAHPTEPLSDADLLRSLLDDAGMTQTQLAAEAGIADSTISAILAGKRRISKGHINAFVRIFRVSPTEFFRD